MRMIKTITDADVRNLLLIGNLIDRLHIYDSYLEKHGHPPGREHPASVNRLIDRLLCKPAFSKAADAETNPALPVHRDIVALVISYQENERQALKEKLRARGMTLPAPEEWTGVRDFERKAQSNWERIMNVIENYTLDFYASHKAMATPRPLDEQALIKDMVDISTLMKDHMDKTRPSDFHLQCHHSMPQS